MGRSASGGDRRDGIHSGGDHSGGGKKAVGRGASPAEKTKNKRATFPVPDEMSETEDSPRAGGTSGMPPSPPLRDREHESMVMTVLLDIQKTQKELLASQREMFTMIATIITQITTDRQRINNLELQVENLQKSRMLGLTHQPRGGHCVNSRAGKE